MMHGTGRSRKRRGGFVLVIVIFFIVLLFASVATFLRRATLDAAIVRNRDYGARAEALARGGVNIAKVLLIQDLIEEQAQRSPPVDSKRDLWAQIASFPLPPTEDGGTLRIEVEDAGARIGLNGLVALEAPDADSAADAPAADDAAAAGGAPAPVDEAAMQRFLLALFAKVIEEMPGKPEEKQYDPEELTRNLIDYLDEDDVGQRGDRENEWYEQQSPPYHPPPDHVLWSVDELALVKGFDRALVEALRPYVTAFPLSGGGVNPNTAPSWVLAALDTGGPAGSVRTEDEEFVKRILKCRSELPLCESGTECQQVGECTAGVTPTPAFRFKSDVFRIQATARYGDVTRVIETVVNRRKPAEMVHLTWSVR
jgi:type II secretory pathway component PulK